jgi:serine/threonine protein kinase
MTEALPGQKITDAFDQFIPPGSLFQGKRCLIRELALFLRKMHERGVTHRDLKGPNILVQEGGPWRYHLYLVDLDGVHLGSVSWRRQVKNLARLARTFVHHPAVTRTDYLRFLKTYLGPPGADTWKEFWGEAAAMMRPSK